MTTPATEAPSPTGTPARERRSAPVLVVGGAILAAALAVMFVPGMSREMIGVCAIAAMLVLIFLNMHIGLALALPAMAGLVAVSGPLALENVLLTLPYDSVAEWTMSVIPMFVFMGLLLWRSGITEQLYDAGKQWLSWLPGGLGVGTTAAGAGLSAVSGSTAGTTYALARIGIPEMLKAGYHKRMAIGSVIVAGLPGQLVPPSILLVVYAGISESPIGPQLLAGIVPGILIAVICAATLVGLALLRPSLVGTGRARPRTSWAERGRTLRVVWPVPALIAIVIGGMFGGIFTATEAGAAGALGALLLTLWKRRGDGAVRAVGQAAIGTLAAVGTIFFLLLGAEVLTRLLAVTRIASVFTDWVVSAGLGATGFLLLMIVVYLALGTFLEGMALLLLTVPVLLPTLEALDISVLWFGVFAVFMGELAVITPPVGIVAFIIAGIVRDPEVSQGQKITIGDVFMAALFFLPLCIAYAILLILVPDIATWLPSLGNAS
ncbi:TRAP transporter large permease [Prauserella cavernicola]|uniref:TRAP transporter large permease subunit n=1 Tax=Prauserella cavernicola TaxID=2800127 RepID=A0A934QXZ0_9PSEU|nr:TRAP transporter large permease subunit [Prauserella cavernicola]MBK1787319.1 TRAP transporter large permease subunit [Prauserella cavernicola]